MNTANIWTITFQDGESFAANTPQDLCRALSAAQTFSRVNTLSHMICLANRAEAFTTHPVSVASARDFLKGLAASGFASLNIQPQAS